MTQILNENSSFFFKFDKQSLYDPYLCIVFKLEQNVVSERKEAITFMNVSGERMWMKYKFSFQFCDSLRM